MTRRQHKNLINTVLNKYHSEIDTSDRIKCYAFTFKGVDYKRILCYDNKLNVVIFDFTRNEDNDAELDEGEELEYSDYMKKLYAKKKFW
jgi:hypothetical protein